MKNGSNRKKELMKKRKRLRKCLKLSASVLVLMIFSLHSACYSLAPIPASKNPDIKRKIKAALEHRRVIYADSDYAKRLLGKNNASSLLLSSGKYLFAEDVTEDDITFLGEIYDKDIKALMQILQKEERTRYNGIKELFRKHFPPDSEEYQPFDRYIDNLVARAFRWILLLEDGYITRNEIPQSERVFIEKAERLISSNKHNYFTDEFWSINERGKRIRKATTKGMRFYQVANKRTPAGDDELYRIAKEFREKKETEGIYFQKAYDELLFGVLKQLGINSEEVQGREVEDIIAETFRENGIRRILEVGCGDCAFLAALGTIAGKAGIKLKGVDLDPYTTNQEINDILREGGVEIYKGDARALEDEEGYDIILGAGVLSLFGLHPMEQPLSWHVFNRVITKAQELLEKSESLLSENPKAAIYVNTFNSMLMLHRSMAEKAASILIWDDSRKISFTDIYERVNDVLGRKLWSKIHTDGASFAVLGKRSLDEVQGDEHSEVWQERIDATPTDADEAVVLLFDVLRGKIQDREYTLKYDQSRLTPSQIDIIKEYKDQLEKRFSVKIKLKPFSTKEGSQESLIAIYSKGKDFSGEGHVNVSVEEGEIGEYLLRITGMVNIAFAASNIPDPTNEMGDDEYMREYGSIIGFISSQFKSIMNKDLALPLTLKGIINAVRNINLHLPEPTPLKYIELYNEMALKALISA